MKYNLIFSIKPLSKLKYLVHRVIDLIDNYEKFGVYITPCKDDNRLKAYTYENWKITKKISDHMADIKKGKLSPALYRLNQDTDIDILFNEAKIIEHVSHYNVCIIRESLEIWTRG